MKALNAHRRVNRLPPELLRLIFLQFIRPTAPSDLVYHDHKVTGDLNILDFNAPNVERLSLSRGHKNHTDYRDHPDATVLKGATEHVKMLSMRHLGPWLPSNQFPALTHLVVSDRALGVYNLCSFLSRCPNIIDINIRDSVCAVHTGAPAPAQLPANTHLRRLRRISLNARDTDLFHVLQINRARTTIELTLDQFNTACRTKDDYFTRRLAIPRGLASRLLAHPDYIRQPLTRLHLKNSPTHLGNGSLSLMNDTAGICFNSAVPLDSEHARLFTPSGGGLDHITELWIDGVDPGVYHLYTALRPDLPNLRTFSILHADSAKVWVLKTLVECLLSETNGTAGTPLAPPALRLVLADGVNLGERKVTRKMLQMLGGAGVPLPEKKFRLILRALRFSPEYYTEVLPQLQSSWEVETELGGEGVNA
ncbi:hypothetical protein TRAPUB_9484 [Trametes pubescens]|uniref:F-box domain-containing protein n=1 Tax=Trametes pubescens TaxID=154538 RepID=A0A1M2W2J7_TRAPU|nr:hypothetical protein TRAPUB_9484 [Trametes pubescens]